MLEGTKATEGNKFFFEYLMHLYILSLSLNPTTLNKITIKFNDKEGITNVTFN